MKSVFDGWTKKVEGVLGDGEGGFCARGWLGSNEGRMRYPPTTTPDSEALVRIGKWIQANLNPPDSYRGYSPSQDVAIAVAWANNECKLDIGGFKMVDLLTQGYVPEDAPVAVAEVLA